MRTEKEFEETKQYFNNVLEYLNARLKTEKNEEIIKYLKSEILDIEETSYEVLDYFYLDFDD